VGELPSKRATDETSFIATESGLAIVDSRFATTGSSYGAEAVELESVERPKKTAIELEEMANADHDPQHHHPRRARARPRSACV
jgi:hypothetical protein